MLRSGKTVEGLLGEIRGLGKSRLDPARLEEVTDEVRNHLDETIRARLELGMNPMEAEQEAVEAFGDPARVVEDLAVVHPVLKSKLWDRGVTTALLSSTLALTIFIELASDPATLGIWSLFVYLAMWLLGMAWIIVQSWRARRLQVLPLVAAVVLNGILYAGLHSIWWSADSHADLSTGMRKADVVSNLGGSINKLKALDAEQSSFYRAYEGFMDSFGSKAASFEMPAVQRKQAIYRFDSTPKMKMLDVADDDSKLVYLQTKSGEEALAAWRAAIPVSSEIFRDRRSMLTFRLADFNDHTFRPDWLNFVLFLPCGLYIGFAVTLWLGVAHLLAVMIRFLVKRRTNGPRVA